MTHGEPDTFPRAGDVIGFCTPDEAVDVAEKGVTIQRDSSAPDFRLFYVSASGSLTLENLTLTGGLLNPNGPEP